MLSINTNVGSLFAQRMVSRQDTAVSRSLERIGSGLRVNSARDDSAGLAISDRMTSQVRGLRQGARNAADGVSIVQTAEGALGHVISNLQRVRELGVQAANAAVLSEEDKASLQNEVNEVLAEVDRTFQSTRFNGKRVFDDPVAQVDTARRQVVDGLRDYWLADAEQRITELFGLTGDGATMTVSIIDGVQGGTLASVSGTPVAGGKLDNLVLTVELADFTPPNLPDGGTSPFFNDRIIAHEMVHAVMGRTVNLTGLPTWFAEGAAELIHGADERVLNDLAVKVAANGADAALGADDLVDEIGGAWGGSSAQYSSGFLAVRYLHEEIQAEGGNGISDVMGYLKSNPGSDLDDALANVATSARFASTAAYVAAFTGAGGEGSLWLQQLSADGALANEDTGAAGGADVDGGAVLDEQSVLPNDSGYAYQPLDGFVIEWPGNIDPDFETAERTEYGFQVGANVGERIDVGLVRASLTSLGLDDLDVTVSPNKTLARVDTAIDFVDRMRGELGATMARMESAIWSDRIAAENTEAARSRIVDADYAIETAELTRATILQQASLSILSQANSAPTLVLELLG